MVHTVRMQFFVFAKRNLGPFRACPEEERVARCVCVLLCFLCDHTNIDIQNIDIQKAQLRRSSYGQTHRATARRTTLDARRPSSGQAWLHTSCIPTLLLCCATPRWLRENSTGKCKKSRARIL